jgi:hypothetical protein
MRKSAPSFKPKGSDDAMLLPSTHQEHHVIRYLLSISVLTAFVAPQVNAQERTRNYVAGMRSALIVGSMDLSDIDGAFANLTNDGIQGPHMSGFFLLYKVRPYLRIGVETLVSNSDQKPSTTMNYQAAGPVLEVSYGRSWFVTGGIHAGGLIVNAMVRENADPSERALSGTFYKGNGLFVAPSVDVGVRFRRAEVGLFAKRVNVSGGKDVNMSGFSSTFTGLRVALGL